MGTAKNTRKANNKILSEKQKYPNNFSKQHSKRNVIREDMFVYYWILNYSDNFMFYAYTIFWKYECSKSVK